jgi:hypothetical protein
VPLRLCAASRRLMSCPSAPARSSVLNQIGYCPQRTRPSPVSKPPMAAGSFLARYSLIGACLCAAAPALNSLGGPPTPRTGAVLSVVSSRGRAAPHSGHDRTATPGIGAVPVYLNFAKGTREEMKNSCTNYEKDVAYLASQHCDTISIEGASALMNLCPDSEAKLVDSWKQKTTPTCSSLRETRLTCSGR